MLRLRVLQLNLIIGKFKWLSFCLLATGGAAKSLVDEVSTRRRQVYERDSNTTNGWIFEIIDREVCLPIVLQLGVLQLNLIIGKFK